MNTGNTTKNYEDLAKSLHTKAEALSVHLSTLTELNDSLKDKLERTLTALKNLCGERNRATCSICYSRESTHVVIPCGHGALCESCATRAGRRNRCHNCRGPVESIMRVYL